MKYVKAILIRVIALLKLSTIKLLHFNTFYYKMVEMVSLSTKFVFLKGGTIQLGKSLATKKNVEFHVDDGGMLTIGDNCFFNNNCMISCHEKIVFGSKCACGPNVLIYDNDHDFRTEGGKFAGKYKTSPVIIGDNVWIGANTVILKGTIIGNNCVVGAGTVLKGDYPDNTIIVQKHETILKEYSPK
jgi:acetyltransferase-like isoleucine patch superfamily enzyme